MAEPSGPADDHAERDWPAQIADTAVRIIEQIRSKTTRPAITIARALVFGLVALSVGMVAGFLLLIGSIRLVNGYLPGTVWTTYLLFGAVFTLVGVLLFSRRKPRAASANPGS
jgi:hypothetical protein